MGKEGRSRGDAGGSGSGRSVTGEKRKGNSEATGKTVTRQEKEEAKNE